MVSRWLKALAQANLLRIYTANSQAYIQIEDFVEHQSWHGLADKGSRIPPPLATTRSGGADHQGSPSRDVTSVSGSLLRKEPSTDTSTLGRASVSFQENPDSVLREARTKFRGRTSKNFGHLTGGASRYAYPWGKLIELWGGEVVVRAVDLFAQSQGAGSLGFPLAAFLKSADEYCASAKMQLTPEEAPTERPEFDEAAAAEKQRGLTEQGRRVYDFYEEKRRKREQEQEGQEQKKPNGGEEK